MIMFLTRMALTVGIPQKFAKAAGIVFMVCAAISLFNVAKCTYDKAIISGHDAKHDAAVLGAGLNATEAADTNATARDNAMQTNDQQTRRDIDDAIKHDPAGGNSSAGPATDAAIDSLRRRREARVH